MIEFDVETTGLQPFSGANEAFLWIFWNGDEGRETAEAIPFSPTKAPIPTWGIFEWTATAWEAARAKIQAWFDRAKGDGIRAWNAKFDRAFAEMAGVFDVPGDGLWYDGMIGAHAMDERRSVALKAVSSSLFGEEAAAPQMSLKDWLNAENRRRAKVLTDADKAKVGKLKIDYVESIPCDDCDGDGVLPADEPDAAEFTDELVMCPECKGEGHVGQKNRKRAANDEEIKALLAEYDELWDPGVKSYKRANYADVPVEIMEPYALEDVYLTRAVSDVYDTRLAQMDDLSGTVEFERKAMDALYGIEKRGLPATELGYRRLEQEVIANLTGLEDRVREVVAEADPIAYAKALAGWTSDKKPGEWGEGKQFVEQSEDGKITGYHGGAAHLDDFSPNSSAHILAALKARGADMAYMSEKDGKLPCDADNLRAVDDELAVAILNFRSEYKVLSTYTRPMLGRSYVSSMNVYKEPFVAPDGRIHATYRQVGARTGRMSCADPNMQNQPRDDLRLRYNIVADPGHVFVACDLTNIEMYLFAAYCGEGRLLTAVQNGEDLHTLTAQMLGLRDRKRAGGGVETARQLGKTYNFSRIYGGGLRTIKRSFRCSMDEARLLKRRFDDAYPEVARLQNRIEYRLQDDGFIQDKLISGRRFRVDPRDAYKATNYLVQGTAASLLKYAVIQLHADGIPMVALVHDEVVAHVPASEAKEVALQIEKRMVEFEGLKGVVPLKAEADIVKHWSDAKPLKDEDGTPYLFTPEWAGGEKRPVLSIDEVLAAA